MSLKVWNLSSYPARALDTVYMSTVMGYTITNLYVLPILPDSHFVRGRLTILSKQSDRYVMLLDADDGFAKQKIDVMAAIWIHIKVDYRYVKMGERKESVSTSTAVPCTSDHESNDMIKGMRDVTIKRVSEVIYRQSRAHTFIYHHRIAPCMPGTAGIREYCEYAGCGLVIMDDLRAGPKTIFDLPMPGVIYSTIRHGAPSQDYLPGDDPQWRVRLGMTNTLPTKIGPITMETIEVSPIEETPDNMKFVWDVCKVIAEALLRWIIDIVTYTMGVMSAIQKVEAGQPSEEHTQQE